jgi:hypothetical protein
MLWVGKYCMENNIEIICLKHDEGYIKYTPQKNTIYDSESKNDRLQTLVAQFIFDKTIILENVILMMILILNKIQLIKSSNQRLLMKK